MKNAKRRIPQHLPILQNISKLKDTKKKSYVNTMKSWNTADPNNNKYNAKQNHTETDNYYLQNVHVAFFEQECL